MKKFICIIIHFYDFGNDNGPDPGGFGHYCV